MNSKKNIRRTNSTQSSPNKATTSELKTVPNTWREVLDEETISRCIARVSYEIVESDRKIDRLAVVGIKTGGEYLGKRIQQQLEKIEGAQIAFGVIDITLYRDDLSHSKAQPTLKGTDIPFSVSGARIILVDDVLYTGRTIRAALDAIIDFGRPAKVELACLVDRGHREVPIRPDYVGKNIPTHREEFVRVRLRELGYKDGVYVIRRDGGV